MSTHKLENYQRAYRKRSGLTQREVAFLLGCQNGAQVSRYEKRRRVPPLRMALACETVFWVPAAELFGGMKDQVNKVIEKRLAELQSKLQATNSAGIKKSEVRLTEQKLRWLDA